LQLFFRRQYAAGSLIKGSRVTLKTELKRKRKIEKGEKEKNPHVSAVVEVGVLDVIVWGSLIKAKMGTIDKKTEMDKKNGDICQKKKRLTSERSLRLVFLR